MRKNRILPYARERAAALNGVKAPDFFFKESAALSRARFGICVLHASDSLQSARSVASPQLWSYPPLDCSVLRCLCFFVCTAIYFIFRLAICGAYIRVFLSGTCFVVVLSSHSSRANYIRSGYRWCVVIRKPGSATGTRHRGEQILSTQNPSASQSYDSLCLRFMYWYRESARLPQEQC